LKYVLDTKILSALMRGDAAVKARIAERSPAELFTPQPALAELWFGVTRLADSKRQRRLKQRLQRIERAIERAVWTDEVSREFARIKTWLQRRGEVIEDFDVAIAAHALAEGATLVTNDQHMRRIPGLLVEDWSEERRQ